MPGWEMRRSTITSPPGAALVGSVRGRKTPTEPTFRVSASNSPSATADFPVQPSGDAMYTLRLTARGYRLDRRTIRLVAIRRSMDLLASIFDPNDQRSPRDHRPRRVATAGLGWVFYCLAGQAGVAEPVGRSQGRRSKADIGVRTAALSSRC